MLAACSREHCGAHGVVVPPPLLDENLRLFERVDEVAVERLGRCRCPYRDNAVARLKRSQRLPSKKPNHPLLESDRIPSAEHAALEHWGIDTHVGLIVLGRRPKDTHILGEVSLGQCCHYAPGAGAIDI